MGFRITAGKLTLGFAGLLVSLLPASKARADNAAFDLIGPRIEMKVTRGGKPLPISQVPNLQQGDRLWIHPDFPEDQAARYILVVAFLRGSTNPDEFRLRLAGIQNTSAMAKEQMEKAGTLNSLNDLLIRQS